MPMNQAIRRNVVLLALQRLAPLFLLATLASSGTWAREPESAAAFLRRIYAPYVAGTAESPTDRLATSLFDPGLLQLVRRDEAAAHGEVGVLDHDPLCACQDYSPLSDVAINVPPQPRDRVTHATVSFRNGDPRVRIAFQLVRVGGRWRIHDIAEPDIPSLRRLLADGLAGR